MHATAGGGVDDWQMRPAQLGELHGDEGRHSRVSAWRGRRLLHSVRILATLLNLWTAARQLIKRAQRRVIYTRKLPPFLIFGVPRKVSDGPAFDRYYCECYFAISAEARLHIYAILIEAVSSTDSQLLSL